MAAFSLVKAVESLWHLDSVTTAYMTHEESILECLTPCIDFD